MVDEPGSNETRSDVDIERPIRAVLLVVAVVSSSVTVGLALAGGTAVSTIAGLTLGFLVLTGIAGVGMGLAFRRGMIWVVLSTLVVPLLVLALIGWSAIVAPAFARRVYLDELFNASLGFSAFSLLTWVALATCGRGRQACGRGLRDG